MTLTLNSCKDFKHVSTTKEDNMANYQGLWSRWHRFDTNGVKYIKKFNIGETPTPIEEQGFSEWHRGTGPLSESHYNNVSAALRNLSLGKPKSPETKLKMSMAKRGKPKSPEHRRNMSLAQRQRFNRKNNEPNTIQQTGPSHS